MISRRCGLWLIPLFAVLAAAGCSTRNDPTYNPFVPNQGHTPWVQHAENAVQTAEEALDNFERRMNNTLY